MEKHIAAFGSLMMSMQRVVFLSCGWVLNLMNHGESAKILDRKSHNSEIKVGHVKRVNRTVMRYLLVIVCIVSGPAWSQASPAYKDEVFTEYVRRTAGWTASD